MKGKELTPRIGIFGRINNGKSSLVNYLTGQDVAIVSDKPGTTTDPVRKTMEISGVGPVVWVDTAGVDDEGALGALRIEKTYKALEQTDLAIILFCQNSFADEERRLIQSCQLTKVPFLLVYSKSDTSTPDPALLDKVEEEFHTKVFVMNVRNEAFRAPLTDLIRENLPESAYVHKSLLGDVIGAGDVIVLVTPIDSSAPEGRMILPQVQVLRDILDNDAIAVDCKETELERTLALLKTKPRLVVTDSQAYGMVSKIVPDDIYLTSFSVVLARTKGLFEEYINGTPYINKLNDGDRVLMLESCTHNVTCEDIGRVKLPALLSKKTGKQLLFEAVGGLSSLPRSIAEYALVIQCGGCVVTPKQLASRLAPALQAKVPVSNYGLALAYLNGIFERSIKIFNNNNNPNT